MPHQVPHEFAASATALIVAQTARCHWTVSRSRRGTGPHTAFALPAARPAHRHDCAPGGSRRAARTTRTSGCTTQRASGSKPGAVASLDRLASQSARRACQAAAGPQPRVDPPYSADGKLPWQPGPGQQRWDNQALSTCLKAACCSSSSGRSGGRSPISAAREGSHRTVARSAGRLACSRGCAAPCRLLAQPGRLAGASAGGERQRPVVRGTVRHSDYTGTTGIAVDRWCRGVSDASLV